MRAFRLVPKSVNVDDLEGPLCITFQNTCMFRRPILLATKI